MKIEGFREGLEARRYKERRLNPFFSSSEASASAAIEILQSMVGRLIVQEIKGGEADNELLNEIGRRVELIQGSRAYKSAARKEMIRLMRD
ncbi:MAG TPA: hypothetical protein VF185_00905 [Patescibacteria group bacterium]